MAIRSTTLASPPLMATFCSDTDQRVAIRHKRAFNSDNATSWFFPCRASSNHTRHTNSSKTANAPSDSLNISPFSTRATKESGRFHDKNKEKGMVPT